VQGMGGEADRSGVIVELVRFGALVRASTMDPASPARGGAGAAPSRAVPLAGARSPQRPTLDAFVNLVGPALGHLAVRRLPLPQPARRPRPT
jgi:hypothetical protein